MIKVSRNEAFYLREKGFGRYIHVSNRTHKKRYYMTEADKALVALENFRKGNIILSQH